MNSPPQPETSIVYYLHDDTDCIVQGHIPPHFYADDTQLYFCTRLIKSRINACIADIAGWMASKHLAIILGKTQFLWCAYARRLHDDDNCAFWLANGGIVPTTDVRDLGAVFGASLSMATHVNRLVSTCRVRALRWIVQTSFQFINIFVFSRISYCNSLLADCQ